MTTKYKATNRVKTVKHTPIAPPKERKPKDDKGIVVDFSTATVALTPESAFKELRKRQNRNYTERLTSLAKGEKRIRNRRTYETADQLNSAITKMACIETAHKIYAREQRRFQKNFDEIWALMCMVFERWGW